MTAPTEQGDRLVELVAERTNWQGSTDPILAVIAALTEAGVVCGPEDVIVKRADLERVLLAGETLPYETQRQAAARITDSILAPSPSVASGGRGDTEGVDVIDCIAGTTSDD